jgi:hypothetical protein
LMQKCGDCWACRPLRNDVWMELRAHLLELAGTVSFYNGTLPLHRT